MKKNILFLSGTRADYGKIKPLMKEIIKNKKFSVNILATGMHLSKRHGYTFNEIKKDFEKKIIFKFKNILKKKTSMDYIFENTVKGLNKFLKNKMIDLVVIHGDRIESLALATLSMLKGIRIAHIEGGELSGTVDEGIRHAISKISTLHFVSNKYAKKNLMRLGENPKNIFIIGSPEVDIMIGKKLPTLTNVKKKYKITFTKYSIICLHPNTLENLRTAKENSKIFFNTLYKVKKNFILIYPNNDKNSEIIFSYIKKINKKNILVIPSMRFEYYLTLLKNADYIIGNSSSGIREAPVFGTKVINIGSRQRNRTENKYIINCDFKENQIINAIRSAEIKQKKRLFIFGSGNSGKKFAEVLAKKRIWKISLEKIFHKFN